MYKHDWIQCDVLVWVRPRHEGGRFSISGLWNRWSSYDQLTMAVQDALWKHENTGTGFRAKPSAMQRLIQKQFPDCLWFQLEICTWEWILRVQDQAESNIKLDQVKCIDMGLLNRDYEFKILTWGPRNDSKSCLCLLIKK